MKVGDLVKYKNLHGHVRLGKFASKSWIGIVVERGKYTGNNDTLVLWNHGEQETVQSEALQVVNESR